MTTQTNQARFLRRFLQKAARRRLVPLRMKEADKLQFIKGKAKGAPRLRRALFFVF
jgi:hypothetical protein